MPNTKFLPLPPDTDLSKPDAVVLLNDRLRRVADSAPALATAAADTAVAATTLSGSPGRPVIGTAAAPKLLAPGETVDLSGTLLRAQNGVLGLSGPHPVRVGTVFTFAGGVLVGYTF